jgi:hypothetical protein
MSYRIVIQVFDTARAIHERRHLHTSDDPAVLSLDTKTGLPPDLDKAVRSLKSDRVPKSVFEDLDTRETPPREEQKPKRALDPAAPAFNFNPAGSSVTTASSPRLKKREFPSLSIEPPFTPLRPLDWRFGPISIEWQEGHDRDGGDDMAPKSQLSVTSVSPAFETRGGSSWADEPMTRRIDVGFGVIHLYRDRPASAETEQQGGSSGGSSKAAALHDEPDEDDGQERDVILAILAIPPVWSVADLLNFVAPSLSADGISHVRILRSLSFDFFFCERRD